MYSQREELFLTFLRAGLQGENLDRRLSKTEFLNLWEDARRQAVRGIIGQAMLSSELLPPRVGEMVQNTLFSIGRQNLKMESVLEKSVAALRAAGVEPVLLKGHGVASHYIQPLSRESGDIDNYVGDKDYEKSFNALLPISDSPQSFVFEADHKHSHVEVDGITIELHRYSEVLPGKYDKRFQKIASEGLTNGLRTLIAGGTRVRIPEPTFDAFFIFNHLWRHFVTEGVGFRQVCDWTMFLHANHDLIDAGRLEDILKTLDLERPWKAFGRIAVDLLGLPAEEMPLNDPSAGKWVPKVVGMMMSEGNFGHEREDWLTVPRESFLDKVHVFFMIARRYFSLVPAFGKVVIYEYLIRMKKKFLG